MHASLAITEAAYISRENDRRWWWLGSVNGTGKHGAVKRWSEVEVGEEGA